MKDEILTIILLQLFLLASIVTGSFFINISVSDSLNITNLILMVVITLPVSKPHLSGRAGAPGNRGKAGLNIAENTPE